MLLCCLLGPILLGTVGLVALGPVLEAVAVGAAVILVVVVFRRHRANRCCR